jgi:hypothetical protein
MSSSKKDFASNSNILYHRKTIELGVGETDTAEGFGVEFRTKLNGLRAISFIIGSTLATKGTLHEMIDFVIVHR